VPVYPKVPENSIPLLLDTDIGSDIDDALALAYLLRQPRCELLGITTVTGDVSKRAALCQMLCEAAGRREIPIHTGASRVLLTGPGQPDVPHYAAVKHRPHSLDWPVATGIEFMRDTVRSRPREVTLLSIGPLTNVALLFATDPEVARLLRGWVSMAGAFGSAGARDLEWNSVCDPLATSIAFAVEGVEHKHIPLDVTLQCRVPAADLRATFKSELLSVVLEMAEVWFKQREEIVLHDPLAAMTVFQPDLCEYRRGKGSVDPETGKTGFVEDEEGPDEVAFGVHASAVVQEFLGVFRNTA
jgi:inosine-uridine nucleoside N-ribohydrolase